MLIALASLVATTVGAELALRSLMPWILPELRSYSDADGLPSGWLERQIAALRASPPDLVVIGDSFVATGDPPLGWISRLRGNTHRSIAALGLPGACPSQYWLILDRLRRSGIAAPVLLLLYLGNDFADETVWASADTGRASYMEDRRAFYSDSSKPTFWPCFEPAPDGPMVLADELLRRHSALYRALLVSIGGLSSAPARMVMRCERPPWSERIGGQLFFLAHHDAIVSRSNEANAAAAVRILAAVAEHRGDPKLTIAVVLDREENCAAVHGRQVVLAAPIIDEIRAVGVRVLDPNPPYAATCARRQLYLPDGHWAVPGHALFAATMQQLLRAAEILVPAAR